MKYYIVALFDRESNAKMEMAQKKLCQKYKLYKNNPMLHIVLETIEDPDIDKLNKVIQDILKPYKRFKVETNGTVCFDPPLRSINLKVENKGYIVRFARQFNETLKLHGFNVKQNVESFDLHVTLANSNYAIKEWSGNEHVAACSDTKKDGFFRMSIIDRVEVWKVINNKKEIMVKSFPLREY